MDTVSPCPHFVYELIDPRDNAVFYIGITIDLYARYRQHMHCDGINVLKDTRIRAIREDGYLPIMHRLELVASVEAARAREQYWIRHYTALGVVLLNAEVSGRPQPRQTITVKAPFQQPPKPSNERAGRRVSFADIVDMLSQVRETGQWPEDVSLSMRRYYRRTYPEFFRNGKQWTSRREAHIRKAALLRSANRPSRSHKQK